MRRLLIGVGIFIVVVVAALLVFAATFNVNKYHDTIQSELEKSLGRTTTLGDMHLSLFPPRFRVQDPAIADDPHFSPDAPFVKAQELDVSVKLMPLLHKQLEISSLILQRPSVNLIKNSAGVWNFASLGQSKTQPKSQPPSQQQFSLGEMSISDGQVSILDQQKSKTPSSV